MKIGTTIFLIVILLIFFGYVLSDDWNVRKSLTEVNGKVDSLELKLGEANQKLGFCQVTVQTDQQTIYQQGTEISFGLGLRHGLTPGVMVSILDEKGNTVGSAQVQGAVEGDATATVESDVYVRPGYLIVRS